MSDHLTDADLDAIEQRARQWATPLAIKCPSCGANPGDRCYGNGPMNRPHGERREAARQRVITDVPALLAEVRRLRAMEQRVRALHRPVDIEPSDTICGECSYRMPNGRYLQQVDYPCPTLAALDGDEYHDKTYSDIPLEDQ